MMRLLRTSIITVSVLVMLFVLAVPVTAATSQDVTVTAVPAFISISNTPGTWTINGITGSGVIAPNTTYYTNPLGDASSPGVTVVDGECRFTVTNTSTVATDITVNFPNHTGGDASTNSGTGNNAATSFGAYGYYSGMTYTNKVIAKASGSNPLISNLAATTNFKWGLEYKSQTSAWTSGTSMTSTVTITATAH